ncbi:MAG: hypothetical protein MJ240_08985 [Kiritimatiellae bacterium]|nr:hypothetical protein [Kiritimatiellia bacterium]
MASQDEEILLSRRVKRSQEEDKVLFDRVGEGNEGKWPLWAVLDTRAGRFRTVTRVDSLHASEEAAEDRAADLRRELDWLMERHGGVILSHEIHDGVEYGLASFRRFTAIIQYSATIQRVGLGNSRLASGRGV